MSQVAITNRTLNNLKPSVKPYFLRDRTLKGFGVKVNPAGTIKFIVEIWFDGLSNRKTMGDYPVLNLQQARTDDIIKNNPVEVLKLKRVGRSNLLILRKIIRSHLQY